MLYESFGRIFVVLEMREGYHNDDYRVLSFLDVDGLICSSIKW
jgi:hypothetical protein